MAEAGMAGSAPASLPISAPAALPIQVDPQTVIDGLAMVDPDTAAQILTLALQQRPELAPHVVNCAVPDLTYPPSKALTEHRSKGIIKGFNPATGACAIDCPELRQVFGADVFLHVHQLDRFTPGTVVTFAVALSTQNMPQAYDLQVHEGGSGGGQQKMIMPTPGGDMNGGMGGSMGMGGMGMGGMGMGCMGMEDLGPPSGCGGGAGKGKGKGPSRADVKTDLGQFVGVVKTFNSNHGYGFVQCDALKAQGHQSDVFVHQDRIGECQVGDKIAFTAYLNSKGQLQGKDCTTLEGGGGGAPKKGRTS